MAYAGWLLVGLFAGAAIALVVSKKFRQGRDSRQSGAVSGLLKKHFHPLPMDDITISRRQFPFRVRADLQRAIDRLFGRNTKILHFCGVRREYSHEGVTLSDCVVESQHNPTVSTPPEYEELNIGEELPIRVLRNGIWLLEQDGVRFAVLLAPSGHFGQITGMQFQVAAPNSPEGTQITQTFFRHLEESILKAESYRGKILSLEESGHSYSGESSGITVHKLRFVERDQVILPETTVSLLDRNVIQFVEQRDRLALVSTGDKKGIAVLRSTGNRQDSHDPLPRTSRSRITRHC